MRFMQIINEILDQYAMNLISREEALEELAVYHVTGRLTINYFIGYDELCKRSIIKYFIADKEITVHKL